MVKLTWKQSKCAIFGKSFLLKGLPDPETCGSAYLSGGKAVAHAFIAGHYFNHHARTLKKAIERLNKDIDKQSIGLFGDDTVEFKLEEAA